MHPLEYLFLHHSLLSTIAFFNKETRRAIQKKSNTGRERRWGEQQSWRPGSSRTCRWSGTAGTRHCHVYSCVVYDVTAEKKSLVFSVLGPWTYTQLVLIYYMYHENFREKTESVVQPMLDTRAPRKVKGFEYLNHGKASVGIFTLLDNRKCRVQICRKLVFFQFMDHRTICSGLQTSFYKLYQVTFRNPFHPELLSDSRKLGGI